MITRKLAVPLINEKILAQAQHCYIATSGITDAGFDFIRSRIPATCKMNIVTSLDGITSPNVLHRVIRHYQGRITLNIYTRGVLNANLYIFDLPFRKSVAFVGSGSTSLEGIKDDEELFWKITVAKEIESLMSWYTSYYEFGTTLNENLVREYEFIYPGILQRKERSILEKETAVRLSHYSLDGIKFRSQYFKKEDFISLAVAAPSDGIEDPGAQDTVKQKMHELQQSTKIPAGLRAANPEVRHTGRATTHEIVWMKNAQYSAMISFGISPFELTISLKPGGPGDELRTRQNLHFKLKEDSYQSELFKMLTSLQSGYTIQALTTRRTLASFSNGKVLAEFLQSDYGFHLPITLQRTFPPGDVACSEDKIRDTLYAELSILDKVAELIST